MIVCARRAGWEQGLIRGGLVCRGPRQVPLWWSPTGASDSTAVIRQSSASPAPSLSPSVFFFLSLSLVSCSISLVISLSLSLSLSAYFSFSVDLCLSIPLSHTLSHSLSLSLSSSLSPSSLFLSLAPSPRSLPCLPLYPPLSFFPYINICVVMFFHLAEHEEAHI